MRAVRTRAFVTFWRFDIKGTHNRKVIVGFDVLIM